MSSLNRIISGTSSGLVRNFFSVIINILSLPIYLTFWSLELYGTWILSLTIIAILKIPIFSYQEYLGNEFLKLGKKNRIKIAKILYGSATIVFIYGVLLFSLTIILLYSTNILHFIKINESLIYEARKVILIIFFTDIFGMIVGLFIRALYPFHYYPKISWIGLIVVVTIPIVQIFAVIWGFELVEVSIVTFFIVSFINIIYFIYIFKLINKEKINYIKFDFLNNLNHLKNSLYLIIGKLAAMFRNNGVRLILTPLLGSIAMVGYVAMKTASNFMLQIFSTFTNSLLVEFIDYINEKDEDKFISANTILYFIFCFIITPFAFFFQMVAPIVFEIWTRDKILFDPVLFASMTTSFLIVMFYLPASMVVRGKNLFKEDLIISILTSSIFVVLLMFLLNIYSIRGAGYSLIIAEIFSCLFIFYFANKWLKKNFITFKKKIIIFSIMELFITVGFIFLYLMMNYYSGYIICIYLIIKFINIFIFWNQLYEFEQKKIIKIFSFLISPRKKL